MSLHDMLGLKMKENTFATMILGNLLLHPVNKACKTLHEMLTPNHAAYSLHWKTNP